MLSRKVAAQLKEIETPFYLYDINLLRQTLESVVYESNKYNYKVHYAIKANNDDYLLSIIREYGIGIDCASGNEVRKAIESGFDPKTVVYAGVGLAGALVAISGGITVGNLTSFLNYANQYTKPFNEISGVITELQNALACAGRIFELIDQPSEPGDAENAAVLRDISGRVTISDVSFSYTKDKKLIEAQTL